MFDRRFVQYFDWGLLGLAIVLGGLGLTTLYSVVTADAMTLEKTLYFKQMLWFCGGLVLMVITCLFNYKLLDRYAVVVYIFCLATLVAVLLFGKYAGGSKRWLVLGPVSVQPSEMAKLA
ncbi:MAG: FtsW/RodA/SpoVE family cell cycle protein, partial [Desulfobacterales bacterium]